MKKIVRFLKDNKIIFITLLLLLYWLLLRLYLPYQIPIHENNHGIFFMNWLYNSTYTISEILDKYIFIKDQFIEQMNYGLSPKIFYSFLVKNLGFSYNIIFLCQILFSLLTVLFTSIVAYKLSWKKILYYAILILGVALPYNIKFSSTDEFMIIWNFFISISLFFYVIYLEKQKYLYLFLGLVFFLLAIYTRNLYLLFSVFYLFLFLFYFLNKKYSNKKLLINSILAVLIIIPLSISRIKVLLFTFDKNSGWFDIHNYLFLPWYFTSDLTPYIYILLLVIWLIVSGYLFIKNKVRYKIIILYYIIIIYIFSILLVMINADTLFLLQERLQNLFVPLFVILSWIGLYCLIHYMKLIYIKIILLIFLTLPFFYIWNIKELYSPFEEYLFLKQNVDILWNNFNLMILWDSESRVFNNFPEFLIHDKKYNIYWISSDDKRYKDFNLIYDKIKNENNYFILSYDCYRWNNIGKNMLKICEDIENLYTFEVVKEKYIENKAYVFYNINDEKMLRIGIYKIIWKKW